MGCARNFGRIPMNDSRFFRRKAHIRIRVNNVEASELTTPEGFFEACVFTGPPALDDTSRLRTPSLRRAKQFAESYFDLGLFFGKFMRGSDCHDSGVPETWRWACELLSNDRFSNNHWFLLGTNWIESWTTGCSTHAMIIAPNTFKPYG